MITSITGVITIFFNPGARKMLHEATREYEEELLAELRKTVNIYPDADQRIECKNEN